MRQVLSEALPTLKDPRIGFVTVTGVRDDDRPRRRRRSSSACSAPRRSSSATLAASSRARRPPGARRARAPHAADAAAGLRIRSRGRAGRADDEADRRARAPTSADARTQTDIAARSSRRSPRQRPLPRHLAREPRRRRARLAARDGPRARAARQGHRDVPRRAGAAPGRVPVPGARAARARSGRARRTSRERVLVAVDCASESRVGAEPGSSTRRRSRSTSTTTTTTRASATSTSIVADASSTGGGARGRLPRARRRADAGDRRGALHRARHRHGPLPVREHDAEGASARGRARRGRRRRRTASSRASTRTSSSRSSSCSRGRSSARRCSRGARSSSRTSCASDFEEVGAAEPYSEGIIDFLRAVEGAAGLGAHPRAAARRRAGAEGVAALVGRRGRRLRDRAQVGRGRAPRGGRLLERPLDRGDHRVHRARGHRAGRRRPRSAGECLPARSTPSGIILVDKPAGPSSFAIVAAVRRRTGARTGHAGTLDPFATGLLAPALRCGDEAAGRASSGSTSATSTEVDLTARTYDRRPRRASVVEEHEPPAAAELEAAARRPARRGRAADSGGVGGEDRRRARLHAAPPRRRGRDAGADDARARAACSTATTDGVARLELHVSLGDVRPRDRRGARRALPSAAAHRDRAVLRRGGRSGADHPARGRAREAVVKRRAAHPSELARAPASGRDRQLRRRPPRPSRGPGRGPRDRARADGDHVRPAPAHRARQPVELLTTLERRLELLDEAGVETTCSSRRSPRSSSG